MRKKHSYEDRLKYMKMLEAGDEIHSVNWLPADEILLPKIVAELE